MQSKISTVLLLLVLFGSCSLSCAPIRSKHTSNSNTKNQGTKQGLTGIMSIPDTILKSEPVLMTFTIYNKSDSALRFCKWHTPFEPFMSKYLEVTMESGEALAYQGPLAKRVVPPPPDSYIEVKARDSITVTVDLKNAYSFSLPGKYFITYSGQNISGIVAVAPESFIYR